VTTPLTPVETPSTLPAAPVVQSIALPSRWLYYALALMAIAFGLTIWFGAKSYEKQLTAADAQYQALKIQNAKDTATLVTHEATRTVQTTQIQMADAVTEQRDKTTELLKAQVVVANATDADVKANAEKYLGDAGDQAEDGTFKYSKDAVQKFTATKIDDDEQSQDNADLQKKVGILQDEVGTTKTDLDTCVTDKAATYKDLTAYKKAATKSKWAKALDVGEKVGIFGAGIVIAHELDKH
jgi:hypothetical protein